MHARTHIQTSKPVCDPLHKLIKSPLFSFLPPLTFYFLDFSFDFQRCEKTAVNLSLFLLFLFSPDQFSKRYHFVLFSFFHTNVHFVTER